MYIINKICMKLMNIFQNYPLLQKKCKMKSSKYEFDFHGLHNLYSTCPPGIYNICNKILSEQIALKFKVTSYISIPPMKPGFNPLFNLLICMHCTKLLNKRIILRPISKSESRLHRVNKKCLKSHDSTITYHTNKLTPGIILDPYTGKIIKCNFLLV